MQRRGRCVFCSRAAREVAATWCWEVAAGRRQRETQRAESLAVCTEHAQRLRLGRLLLRADKAYGLKGRAEARRWLSDSEDARSRERQYLRDAVSNPTRGASRSPQGGVAAATPQQLVTDSVPRMCACATWSAS